MGFEEIYEKYFGDVYHYVRRLSGDEHLAEEITSETFFRALKSIGDFRGECDLRVWLCQIARNCYYTYLKKKRPFIPVDDAGLAQFPDPGTSIEEKLTDRETAGQLRDLLHTLPDPYKEVFLWRVFAELSFRQIGQIFGKSENWACVTYHRARTMLKNRLEEQDREKRM